MPGGDGKRIKAESRVGKLERGLVLELEADVEARFLRKSGSFKDGGDC